MSVGYLTVLLRCRNCKPERFYSNAGYVFVEELKGRAPSAKEPACSELKLTASISGQNRDVTYPGLQMLNCCSELCARISWPVGLGQL